MIPATWLLTLYRAWRRGSPARARKEPRCRYHPAVETLEDRTLLSYTVTSLNDGTSPGTLRYALTSQSDPNIIFQSGLNGTLALNEGPLVISSNYTIFANPTQNQITISGDFANTFTGVFKVTNDASATITGLTIIDGKQSTAIAPIPKFGAVYVQSGATLTVNGCTFDANTNPDTSAGAGGGAILNAGTLNVTNSTFNNNSGPRTAAPLTT